MTRKLDVREDQWQQTVTDTLDLYGWKWHHPRPARRSSGRWETPVQGTASRGFPDLVCIRPPRLVFIELKAATTKIQPEQQQWNSDLIACGQEAYILRMPGDLDYFMDLVAPDPQQLSLTSNSTSSTWTPR